MISFKNTFIPVTTIFALSFSGTAHSDMANGEKLHATTCVNCHVSIAGGDGSSIYTRPNRRVKDLTGLKKQVTFCERNLGLTWFDEQINDVTEHLNNSYYKFSQ